MYREHRLLMGVATIVAAMATGCADSVSPASPAAPSTIAQVATVEAVTIAPEIRTLRVGQSQQYDLHVVLTDGTPPSVGLPSWASSQPSVLSIEPSGRATAHATGTAIVSVDVKGGRGLLEIIVSD
jgi:uncharacterized protein YjdB